MRVLVTGGAGFVGSHTLVQLLREKHDVLVVDDFSNSFPHALQRVRRLVNQPFVARQGDISTMSILSDAFSQFSPDTVIHFAGLKAVSDSRQNPIQYYANNVGGTINLLECMGRHQCRRIVFSSSATVYGASECLPYDEHLPLCPTNPYGRTKYFIEQILKDWVASSRDASAIALRYFNPAGSDASGIIGEEPKGVPNNLLPQIARVADGSLSVLDIYGGDYPTRDGTPERDYVHVEDVASAHIAAATFASQLRGFEAINIGTGQGTTVLEMVSEFEAASGRKIPYVIRGRRSGDAARSIAAVEKSERLLGWRAKYTIRDICNSSWRWQAGFASRNAVESS